MAYKIMLILIGKPDGLRKTNKELLDIADVYYASGRLTDDEYTDVVLKIQNEEE